MYAQKVEEDIAASPDPTASSITLNSDPKLTIHPYSELAGATLTSSNDIILAIRNVVRATERETYREYDIVICGTGYERSAWKEMLFPTAPVIVGNGSSSPTAFNKLFATSPISTPFDSQSRSPTLLAPNGEMDASIASPSPYSTETSSTTSYSSDHSDSHSTTSSSASSSSSLPQHLDRTEKENVLANECTVSANYRLRLPETTVGGGKFEPTIWLQGCNEASHGISDSLLSCVNCFRHSFSRERLLTEIVGGWQCARGQIG